MVVLFRFLSLLFLPRLTRAIRAVPDQTIFARLCGTLGCIGIALFLFVSPAISSDFFPNLSYTHLEAGKTLLNKGEVDEAINEFRVAIQLHPSNAEAHSNLGYALGRKGDPNGVLRVEASSGLRRIPSRHAAMAPSRSPFHPRAYPRLN